LLDSALAADPDSVVALTFLAFTHTQLVMRRWSDDTRRDTAAAAAAIDRALALQPNYWPAHFHRSFVMYLQGEVDAAARECEAVLALWPNEPHALQRLGFYRLLQGRVEEVATPVNLAMRLNPLEPTQMASGHFYLGMALFHQQRDEEAYDELRQAVAANPGLGLPRLWMASIDALRGRDADARANLQAFLRVVPNLGSEALRASDVSKNPAYLAGQRRFYDGIRKAGFPPA
jgi:Tfp pilus assembly protein PilF